jgi:ribosomal protein L29
MDFLNFQDVRKLKLSDHDPNFKRLEKFLKKLRIKVRTGVNGSKSRIKTIRGLIPAAGEFIFEKDSEETSVQVRKTPSLYMSLLNFELPSCSNISTKHMGYASNTPAS